MIELNKYKLSEFKISWVYHNLHPFLIITHPGHIKKISLESLHIMEKTSISTSDSLGDSPSFRLFMHEKPYSNEIFVPILSLELIYATMFNIIQYNAKLNYATMVK